MSGLIEWSFRILAWNSAKNKEFWATCKYFGKQKITLFLMDDSAKAQYAHYSKKIMLLIYSNQNLTICYFRLNDLAWKRQRIRENVQNCPSYVLDSKTTQEVMTICDIYNYRLTLKRLQKFLGK